jgi:hypothetical protein
VVAIHFSFPTGLDSDTVRYCKKDGEWQATNNSGQIVSVMKGRRWMSTIPLRDPATETEPRIMIQILYNLLQHVEDERPKCGYNAWAMGDAQRRVHKLQRLAKVYVQKTGGIVH